MFLVLAIAAGVAPSEAQTPPPPRSADQPSRVEFLPRFDFHVSMEHLTSDEARFVWDANFGSDLDIIDFGHGRVNFAANYQAMLGNEFRAFDPNQGNYALEGSVSGRADALEVAGVFHHVSRHLSDRPKRDAVDWNMIGLRVRTGIQRGESELQARADVRTVILKSLVDYDWELDTGTSARVALRPTVALIATGAFRFLGVDGSRNRGNQFGYRGEGGVRVDGRNAALDLFVAAERRIDPYQLEFSTATWVTVGFRVSSLTRLRVP